MVSQGNGVLTKTVLGHLANVPHQHVALAGLQGDHIFEGFVLGDQVIEGVRSVAVRNQHGGDADQHGCEEQ
jgi:hypothetical protein